MARLMFMQIPVLITLNGILSAMERLAGRTRAAALATALAFAPGYASAQSEKPATYVDILHQLTDLDRLTHLQTGSKGGLFSSWDRNSRTYWGANGDVGQYLRIEPDGEAVMMDIDGPGVIYRTWSANPMGKLRVYLDGALTPSFEWDFPDLFDGKLPPFHQAPGLSPRQSPVSFRLLSADPLCQTYQDHRRQGAWPVLPL